MNAALPGRPCLAVRLARASGFDRNPLRRASDRVEALIRTGLLLAFLIGAPVAAVLAGQWTADSLRQGESAAGPVLTALMTLSAAALVVRIALRVIRLLLDWRRLAAWEAAWRAIGPLWTGYKS